MIKFNKFKKLLYSLLILCAALFIKAPSSQAAEKYFSSFNDLFTSKSFYCEQFGSAANPYGFHQGVWKSESSRVYRSDGSQRERALAYILEEGSRTGNGGYNNNSIYQRAVWKWCSGGGIGNDPYGVLANDGGLYDRAMRVTSIPFSNDRARIEVDQLKIIDDVGSLNIRKLTGKIYEMEITWLNPLNNQKYTQTISTGSSRISEWIEVYSDEKCSNLINIDNVSEGSEIYLKNLKTDYTITDAKLKVLCKGSGYKVTVTEWKAQNGIEREQDLITASIERGKDSNAETSVEVIYPTGLLRITKADEHFNEVLLNGAQFKIHSKNGWVVKLSNGTIIYTGSESEATEFTTKDKGQIEAVLRYGKYDVYETKAPVGYDITKQDGYMNNNEKDPYSFSQNNKWVYTGRAEIYANTLDNNVLKYTVTNKKVVDKLRGRVWVDNPDTKANNYNNILDENGNDKLIAGIKVILRDKNNKEIAVTTTDANGYYEFTSKNSQNYTGEDKNLYYWELAGSYVEFTYDNQTYIVVDPFVGNNLKVNSKAMEYKMTVDELEDEKLTGTEGNLAGKAITYRNMNLTPGQILANNEDPNKDLKTTPLTGYYNNETYTVDDINLGIKEKVDPSYLVDEKLEYIKVKMKGYTYTYKYGDTAVTGSQFVPKVNKEIATHTYTSSIYPTDIAYNKAESTDEMKVYVVYSIAVTNNEVTNVDDRYVEQRLYLDSLTNYYDETRYELSTEANGTDEENKQFALWNGENGTASYNLNDANSAYKDGMGTTENDKTRTSLIQFRIKDEELRSLLNRKESLENEEKPTTTIARK